MRSYNFVAFAVFIITIGQAKKYLVDTAEGGHEGRSNIGPSPDGAPNEAAKDYADCGGGGGGCGGDTLAAKQARADCCIQGAGDPTPCPPDTNTDPICHVGSGAS
uniref:Uncharacterized protein n=1 Tax=Pseudodiaptomus poplesia TaxID=213370 RepID=A0A0U2M9W7_9MAXI|nr:hypothetical protein [Pseudodiaptomus poplesia]